MWIIDFLPEWIFYILFFIGFAAMAASLILKNIVLLNQYKVPLQVISILVIILATWFDGGISNQKLWEAKVKQMQLKVAKAQEQSKQTNAAIQQKVILKTQVIKERGSTITEYIDREIVKYDTKCTIPEEFVEIHNRAAELPK